MSWKCMAALILGAFLVLGGVCWVIMNPQESTESRRPVESASSVSGSTDALRSGDMPHDPSVSDVSVTGAATRMPTEDSGLISPPSEAAVEEDPRIAQIEAGVEPADIPAALEYLQSKGAAGKYGDLMVKLVRQLAESNLGQAVRWVEQIPSGEARLQAIKHVSILWAITNAVEAIEWIKELPEGEERNIALTSASYEIARTDPLLAMATAITLPVSEKNDSLIAHIALQWAGTAPYAAAQWAEELPEEGVKERIKAYIATAWAETDPVRASQYALFNIEAGRRRDDAVIAIVQRWVQQDPAAAAEWVSSFPTGQLSETAAENIIKIWPGGFPDAP